MTNKALQIVLVLLPFGFTSASAQVGRPVHERSVQSVLERVASGNAGSEACVAILAQTDIDLPVARVDSVATGLVQLAIGNRLAGVTALDAFVIAAHPTQRRPYSRSFDMILEIIRLAENPGLRGAALSALGMLPNTPRAVEIWREIATQTEPDPGFSIGPILAVGLMCSYGGTQGQQLLRTLHQRGELNRQVANQVGVMIRTDFKKGCPRFPLPGAR